MQARQTISLTTLRTITATAVMAVDAVFGVIGWHAAGFIITTLRIMVLAGTGGVAFVVAGVLLGLEEIRALPGMILRC